MIKTFKVENREDERFNLYEVDEYGNKILRIGGATFEPTEKDFNDLVKECKKPKDL